MPMVVCDAIFLNCARNEKGKHSASTMSIARIVTLNDFDCNPDPESLQNLIIGYVFIIKNRKTYFVNPEVYELAENY